MFSFAYASLSRRREARLHIAKRSAARQWPDDGDTRAAMACGKQAVLRGAGNPRLQETYQ